MVLWGSAVFVLLSAPACRVAPAEASSATAHSTPSSRFYRTAARLIASAIAPTDTGPARAPRDTAPTKAVTPVHTAEAEQKLFHMVPGYHLELVASEPLVQDPVAIDFDADGRMYVVEMRGYMPNLQGTGEDRPVGRIVVLEDTNGDGKMDKSTVFMDSLVLPRAVKVLEHGVLVAAPPNLWLARDTTGDLRADTKELIRKDYGGPGNPEHLPNGLMWGIDNWIHNANYGGQFRVGDDGKILYRKTPDIGQWGLSQDETGRIYRNSNEDPLRADLVSSHYAMRNPDLPTPRGVYEQLTKNVAVYPAHKTPAVNRGYRAETMRADSTLAHYTSAGAATAYVGDRLPAELKNGVFVMEPAGNMVGHLLVQDQPTGIPTVKPAYDKREFLTATDERFRPTNITTAPDGTIYIVDMYRGIIQHRVFITGYLEQKIIERGMEQPIGLGRIWRVVHNSTAGKPAEVPRLSSKTPAQLVPVLAHPNGWWRITAQRLLVERRDSSVAPALRTMARTHPDARARLHAFWTLDGLHAADRATIVAALGDKSPPVRAAAIRVAEPMLAADDAAMRDAVMRLSWDHAPAVRQQLAASLGELPASRRENALLAVAAQSGSDPVVADMIVSSLADRELAFLERLLTPDAKLAPASAPVVSALTRAIIASHNAAKVERALLLVDGPHVPQWQRVAVLTGARRSQGQGRFGGGNLTTLSAPPVWILAAASSRDSVLRVSAVDVASTLTWPGKKVEAAPAKPLTAVEQKRYETGHQQYLTTCAACHQVAGTGLANVAKPLVGSEWALGVPERVIRIVLHGKEGTMLMPPIGSSLTNDQIAAVLTYVRRSWGNSASAIDATQVAEVRGATLGRKKPWTEEELRGIRR
jgi:mono/diheme cytochrome c family protein/glucose/arabinose dehydrogenase